MAKKKKIILIVSLSLVGSILTYFGGGFLATTIVTNSIVNRRGESSQNPTQKYMLQKNRIDYPSLANFKTHLVNSRNEILTGYLFECSNPFGVVVTAHGFGSNSSLETAQLQDYFLSKNWNVFAFDMSGLGNSTGTSMHSLFESKYCVEDVVKYLQNLNETKDLPICLVGHSWGAYGSVMASKNVDVSAVCSFSSYDTPDVLMYEQARSHAGEWIIVTKPAFESSLFFLNGGEAFSSASEVIKNNQNTSYFLVQGSKDKTVDFDRCSMFKKVDEKYALKVSLDYATHYSPWRSKQAFEYEASVVNLELNKLHNQYGDNIPENVFDEFLSSIDKEKLNEINTSLMEQINDFFLDSINK